MSAERPLGIKDFGSRRLPSQQFFTGSKHDFSTRPTLALNLPGFTVLIFRGVG